MATEMITLKLDSSFLGNIDNIVRSQGYNNRTEFVRSALREKIEEIKLKEAMFELSELKGKAKHSGDYETARKKAFEEISKRLK